MLIPGYQINEQIYESTNSLIYRGKRLDPEQAVIVKMLKQAYPPPEKIAWFKREYEMTRSLSPLGVVEAYSFYSDRDRWAIILEDFGGESLKQLLPTKKRLTVSAFWSVAIQVADSLGKIHLRHIIHKDINPSNIVFNPQTGQVKLIDFGISTALDKENQTLRHPNVLEGTLAYISPEQTGRMNRAIDYRTDFYSLGVTFYELLTGQLPFPTDDAMELVHSHIAKQPTPPHLINPEIPQTLSEIVIKLMAKNAEERYQSAFGFKADLAECQRQWEAQGQIHPFPLAQQDISDRFHISQKLYGRESEIATLLAAFARLNSNSETSSARAEMMLIAGYSGIGKSALVQEVYKPITEQRGYFISGKFDQYQRDIPYSSLVQAFSGLVGQLLTESETQIAAWRSQILAALGDNGQVMIDVIPELELIIGSQPPVPDLAPAEAQNRFNLVFQSFIKVFTIAEHPLVVFLDDLQWSDNASLQLIALLMAAADTKHLFLIGAYRDNEVSLAHPLMLTLDEIRQSGTVVNQITLAPLDLANVNQLIVDSFHDSGETAAPLAELVLSKTNGNPFFINEFLKSLYSENLLNFEAQELRWVWDLAQIQARNITDNVVELMAGKVQKLGAETQKLLQLAACIGNQFDLQTLAIVSETTPEKTAADLWPAATAGLILPLSDTYKLMAMEVQGLAEAVTVEYKFAHDRIQQAAYSLINATDKPALHWQVGCLLRQNTPAEKPDQKIFDIVNQLNQGRSQIQHQTEAEDLAQLNLKAGKKAKASAAYQPAFNYLQTGFSLLSPDSWDSQYDLTLSLHVEAAEAAYLSGHFQQMEELAAVVRSQAKTVLDKVRIYRVSVLGYANQHQLSAAIRTGLEILSQLGINLPENPTPADIGQAIGETQAAWAGQRIEDLIHLPEMTDPEKIAAMDLLFDVIHPAYDGNPGLFTLCALQMVNLSIKYGNTPLSAQGYGSYGIVLCGVVFDIDSGYKFAHLALNLLEKSNIKKIKSAVFFLAYYFSIHWQGHIEKTLKPFLEGYQSGLATGDLLFAAFNAYGYASYLYWAGKKLALVAEEMAKYSQGISQIKQSLILSYQNRYWQVVLNLMGSPENAWILAGAAYDEVAMMPNMVETHDRYGIGDLHLHKFILAYLFDNYQQAIANADIAANYLDAMLATPSVAGFYFYDSLTRLAVFADASETEQAVIQEKVTANQEKMQLWAHHAPMNYQHKYDLVAAELCRVQGNYKDAREYYDAAINGARENEFLNEEALAYELAGRFYLWRHQTHIARHYLQDAHYTYQQWGATAKVQHLEQKYPQFLGSATSKTGITPNITSTTGTGSGSALDFATILKATSAISGEIVLEKLLSKLMQLAIENAGAETGFLILSDNGRLTIEAAGTASGEIEVLQAIPVANNPNLPVAIINYTARTRTDVVLNDATQEGLFATDAYITRTQAKSVLSYPILNGGQLLGILYLENNLATSAFTSDRLEVLRILSSQAAISVENALLYRTLAQKVEERTAQLAAANQEITILNQMLQAENLRMSAELDVTRRLQQMILPDEAELSAIPGLEIAGFMEPASEVGGDYYDVLNYDGRVKIGIGDVTGHGLESGMLMIMTQTAVRTLLANNETDYVKFLSTINRTIYDNVGRMKTDKNLTLCLLDYNAGVLRVSGQHEEIIVVRSGGELELIDTIDLGFPIGLDVEIADFISQTEIVLNPGDVVVLYTDGITEAENIDGVQYGLERLCQVVERHWQSSAPDIRQVAINDLLQHIGDQKVFDDITIMVLKQK
uniref:GAF domain-containing protein n=1 Tax=Planktothricoides sp. SpSt-374 TaxID=2282167 RepID=A0A7C3ZLG2_9CYAN